MTLGDPLLTCAAVALAVYFLWSKKAKWWAYVLAVILFLIVAFRY